MITYKSDPDDNPPRLRVIKRGWLRRDIMFGPQYVWCCATPWGARKVYRKAAERLPGDGYGCWPWAHDWDIRRGLSVGLRDFTAKGELWRCRKCPKVKAK